MVCVYFDKGSLTRCDHLPITTTINADPIRSSPKPPSWILCKAKWPSRNADLSHQLASTSFKNQTVHKKLLDSFMDAITSASEKISRNQPSPSTFQKSPAALGGTQSAKPPWRTWIKPKESGVAHRYLQTKEPPGKKSRCGKKKTHHRRKKSPRNRLYLASTPRTAIEQLGRSWKQWSEEETTASRPFHP